MVWQTAQQINCVDVICCKIDKKKHNNSYNNKYRTESETPFAEHNACDVMTEN